MDNPNPNAIKIRIFQLNKILRRFERSMDGYYFEVCAIPQESGNEESVRVKLEPEAKELMRKKAETYDERIEKILKVKPYYYVLWRKTKTTIQEFEEKYKDKNYKIVVYKGKAHGKTEVPDFNFRSLMTELEEMSSELEKKNPTAYQLSIAIGEPTASTSKDVPKEEETSTENSKEDQHDKKDD